MDRKAVPSTDLLTVITISAVSFILATALHEHGGHALACAALGGKINELGAFYVDCDAASVSTMGNRLVAVAGPLISLLAGVITVLLFRAAPRAGARGRFFLWHFATINLMIATGYMLFSGISGLGDLGTGESGALFLAGHAGVWQILLAVAGIAGYLLVLLASLRNMDHLIGGEGTERVGRAQLLALVSYISGVVVAVLIGALNPHGIVIVLVSSIASSAGGTSGLAWMMQLLDRRKVTGNPALVLGRSWAWIITGAAFLAAYAAVLGPTVYG